MILKDLKTKLNNENENLLMFLPMPRTSSISMSSHIKKSNNVFTCRNYELKSCYYEPTKSFPFINKTSENKDDWELINFVSTEQEFFINKLSTIKDGFYKNIFEHENKKIFTIVRNPIDRLFSTWNYCTNSNHQYQFFSIKPEDEKYKINDFNKFVEIFVAEGLPEKYPTEMFSKMVNLLDISLDKNKLLIYKFEEIQNCLDMLRVEYDIDQDYNAYNASNRSIEKNISPYTIEIIKHLYKEDFDIFEYD